MRLRLQTVTRLILSKTHSQFHGRITSAEEIQRLSLFQFRHHKEFLPAFLAAAHLRFAPSESLRFAAADSLRLPRFGFSFPKGKDVAGPLVVLGLFPGRRPRRPFSTACPSRAEIALEIWSRCCFNVATISLMFIAGL